MMVQLIEPDGTGNAIVPMSAAISYCREHAGWNWKFLEFEE